MAMVNVIPIGSARFRAASVVVVSSSQRNPDQFRHRSYRNWWSPLFGGYSAAESNEYVDSSSNEEEEKSGLIQGKIESGPKAKANKSDRFAPGGFTEEKARHLRLLTTAADTASFHEVMYHSAIASRLASDFSKKR